MAVRQIPSAPAAAFEEVASFLGDDWFATPAPAEGLLVVVVGRDGVETRWHLAKADARRVTAWCRVMPTLGVTRVMDYRSVTS